MAVVEYTPQLLAVLVVVLVLLLFVMWHLGVQHGKKMKEYATSCNESCYENVYKMNTGNINVFPKYRPTRYSDIGLDKSL